VTFPLTTRAERKLDQINIEPTYAFCVDGVEDCFTAVTIQKLVRFDDGLFFDLDVWNFDGVVDLDEQKEYISLQGSSKSIRQQLKPDKGSVSSISSVTIRLIDKNNDISKLISPGVEIVDILGRDADLFVGFKDTAFPEDYVKIFRGPISDVVSGAGWVEFTVNHPDEKKRTRLFEKAETTLNGAINDSTTTIVLDDASELIEPSDSFRSFVRIEEEFIEYTGISGDTLTGVSRGALALLDSRAIPASHDDEEEVVSFYLLEDTATDLALKLMLSDGTNGNWIDSVEMTHFGQTDQGITPNSIYIQSVNITSEYGLVAGDFVTTTGATEVANQLTNEPIVGIIETGDGSYIEVAGPLTQEIDTSATLSFKSQFATLPGGAGLNPREVDVARHIEIEETFLAGFNLRFYLKDTMENVKDFINEEIYVPAAMYSLPRGTKSSVGLHVAPFPFSDIRTINKDNVKKPSEIRLRRSFANNFYNNIVFKFDEDLYEDEFASSTISVNLDSIDELGRKNDFLIESKGLRTDLQAVSLTSVSGGRLLDRYKRGAEYIEGLQIFFSDGVVIEPGDAIIFDPTDLSITNTLDGTRKKESKFWEVTNKKLDLSGSATIDITDTSFDGSQRYALFSPASLVDSATTSQVTIKASFSAPFGENEWRKWQDFIGAQVQIRNDDFTDVGVSTISAISGNTITLSPPLAFTPGSDYTMEFAPYDQQTNERVKLLYTHNSDDDNDFADGGQAYVYL